MAREADAFEAQIANRDGRAGDASAGGCLAALVLFGAATAAGVWGWLGTADEATPLRLVATVGAFVVGWFGGAVLVRIGAFAFGAP